jgi:hypothetical protein
MEPDIQEALAVLERACSSVQGDLRTHQVIQNALETVKTKLGGVTLGAPNANGRAKK